MFRKLLIAAISLGFISNAQALAVYVAPMLLYQSYSASNNIGYEGILAQLALGAGSPVSDYPIYLGAEVFVDSKPITVHNNRNGTEGLKPGYSLGVSFVPGICLDETVMLYAHLGLAVTNFQNLNTSKHGYLAGIGLAARLNPVWNIRGEYVYVKYNSISSIGAPGLSQFGIGLSYQFA